MFEVQVKRARETGGLMTSDGWTIVWGCCHNVQEAQAWLDKHPVRKGEKSRIRRRT